ncbi:hypothetical protein Tsubulata_025301 [Turnera subulata]|uniref:SET domain-containing protein n=1 Tax=Turnera subulata TaxID=218843 RepID=A0A9Q0IY80_9ROSI|nr:hypothetical protein Tsubulata_025301 [Turnera subulata]
MPPNPRIIKAYKAMKAIGIPEPTVYDKNWELIEDEEYRVLVNAIFDARDDGGSGTEGANLTIHSGSRSGAGAVEGANDGNTVEDGPERPLKRLRRGLAGQISSTLLTCNSGLVQVPLVKPKEETEELAGTDYTLRFPGMRRSESLVSLPHDVATNMGKQAVPPTHPHEPHIIDMTLPPYAPSTQNQHANVGQKPLVPQVAQREVAPRESANGALAFPVPKDVPLTDDLPQYHLPILVFPPDSSANEDSSVHIQSMGNRDGVHSSATRLPGDKFDDAHVPSGRKRATCGVPGESPANLEIATSPMGEVKLSLICNSIVGRPDFHMPSQQELLKSMEEKCLRSYKILDPNFSVKKMLKDICECFLELATDSSCESHEGLFNVELTGNLLKKPAAYSFLGGSVGNSCLPANALNRAVDANHEDGAILPEIPMLCYKDAPEEGCFENNQGEQVRDPELCDSVDILHCKLPPAEFRALHNINDISKGEETVEIPWLNEITKECLPYFDYIPRNIVFQNASVNFTLSQIKAENCCSDCVGDCLSSSTVCVCSLETIHGFAYTANCLVKEDFLQECISMNQDPKRQSHSYCRDCPIERAKGDGILEPCQGHLNRLYIKECWNKCFCYKSCGNRVVQRGITCKLQVFFTPEGKGWGVRTLGKLPKGAFVCEYVGEILTTKEFFKRKMKMSRNEKRLARLVPLAAYWSLKSQNDEEALCLDATFHGNVARFINHRCLDANLIEIPVKIESPEDHYYHDYGVDFDDDVMSDTAETFQCLCGSKFCRDVRRSNSKYILKL